MHRNPVTDCELAVATTGNHWLADTYKAARRADACLTLRQGPDSPSAVDTCEQPREHSTAAAAAHAAQPHQTSYAQSTNELSALLLALSPPRAPWLHNSSAVQLASATLSQHNAKATCWHAPGETLADTLQHNNHAIAGDLDRRVVLLQLSLAVASVHASGGAHGAIVPSNIHVTHGVLVSVRPSATHGLRSTATVEGSAGNVPPPALPGLDAPAAHQRGARCGLQNLPKLTARWCARGMSTFEYLLHVNAMAGRRWGDLDRLPLFPWVLDFSSDPRPGLQQRCDAAKSACAVRWRFHAKEMVRTVQSTAERLPAWCPRDLLLPSCGPSASVCVYTQGRARVAVVPRRSSPAAAGVSLRSASMPS
jgi:hypothetical protein